MGRIGRGVQLIKLSWSVIMKEKSLLVFPVISGILSIMVAVSFIVPFFVFSDEEAMFSQFTIYLVVFLFYLVSFFVTIFFNVALMSNAMAVMEGRNPSFSEGLAFAASRVKFIFYWAVFAATVGLILQAIREKGGFLGQIAAGLLGVAWSIATFFVIPVMAFEKLGPLAAIKRSAGLFKATWGETIVSGLGIGLIFLLLGLAGIVPIVLVAMYGSSMMLLITFASIVVYWVLLAVIASAMNQVLVVALFRFANTGKTYLDVDKKFAEALGR